MKLIKVTPVFEKEEQNVETNPTTQLIVLTEQSYGILADICFRKTK